MLRIFGVATIASLLVGGGASAQSGGVMGEWRGTLESPGQGTSSPFVLVILEGPDGLTGITSGMGSAAEVPLTSVTASGNQLSIEATADSRLGTVTLSGALTATGDALDGAGSVAVGEQRFPVTFALRRRARRTVLQPQVEQRAEYFVGRWSFEYVGAEYPPLSAGTRSGAVTFSRVDGAPFVHGQVVGDVYGERYEESLDVGYDASNGAVLYVERRPDGTELLSVGNWQSPLAITFETAPVESAGKTYRLRRVISVRSDTAFDVTEELSIDDGPFRRLGNATYTKQ